MIEIYKFGLIQTSQTGRQLYSDTSTYEVSECLLTQDFFLPKTFKLRQRGKISPNLITLHGCKNVLN